MVGEWLRPLTSENAPTKVTLYLLYRKLGAFHALPLVADKTAVYTMND
jgi:hypothetical protein